MIHDHKYDKTAIFWAVAALGIPFVDIFEELLISRVVVAAEFALVTHTEALPPEHQLEGSLRVKIRGMLPPAHKGIHM